MANLCLFVGVLVALICRARLSPSPRNFHGKCDIRLNEIFLSTSRQSYVEIAKICKPGKEFDANTRLTGFALVVIGIKENSLNCVHATKLNDKLLNENLALPQTPVPTVPSRNTQPGASTVFNGNRGLDVLQSRARIPAFIESANSRSTVSQNHQITKRDTVNYRAQTNSKLFNVIDIPTLMHFNTGLALVALLKLDYKQMKRQLPCRLNSKVEEAELNLIKLTLHDIAILQASTGVEFADLVERVFPQRISIDEIELPLYHMIGSNIVSFSKCDNVISHTEPSRYKISPLTKGFANMCDLDSNFINKPKFNFPYGFRDDVEFMKKRPKALAAGLLNVAESSIRNIERRLKNDKLFKPGVKRKVVSTIQKAMMKPENKDILYKTVTSFYGNNTIPTLHMIYEEFLRQIRKTTLEALEATGIQENDTSDDYFTCCPATFSKIMKTEGYKYGRLNNRDGVLFDPKRIAWRRRYLRRLRENRETNEREVVFLDETWHDPHARIKHGWKKCKPTFVERKELAPAKSKISRGGRLIILGAGGKFGFVKDSIFVKKISKTESGGDYHTNIDQAGFQEWFVALMKNWEKISNKKMLIVMDNAPYHTTHSAPTTSARKAEIIQWLKTQKDQGFEIPDNFESMLYIELKEILKKLKEETPRFKIDDMARAAGHEILRLPPYNCELNPIELVWKDVKHQLLRENREQDVNLQLIRAKNAMLTYTTEQWKRHVEHVERLEDSFWDGDQIFDNAANSSLVIQEELDALINEPDDATDACNITNEGDDGQDEPSEEEAVEDGVINNAKDGISDVVPELPQNQAMDIN